MRPPKCGLKALIGTQIRTSVSFYYIASGDESAPIWQTMFDCRAGAATGQQRGWVGLGWVGLGWVGLGWVGLGWVG